MYRQAFAVLDAIGRGADVDPADRDKWVEALKTIRWVVETTGGLALTTEGRQARDEMAAERAAAR
jgi:hypothetical protein